MQFIHTAVLVAYIVIFVTLLLILLSCPFSDRAKKAIKSWQFSLFLSAHFLVGAINSTLNLFVDMSNQRTTLALIDISGIVISSLFVIVYYFLAVYKHQKKDEEKLKNEADAEEKAKNDFSVTLGDDGELVYIADEYEQYRQS